MFLRPATPPQSTPTLLHISAIGPYSFSETVVILAKILTFKGNSSLDGRKMQKNFTLKSFLNTFKETLRVKTLEEGGRRKKLFEFFKTSFSKYLANHNSKMPNLKSSYLVLKC